MIQWDKFSRFHEILAIIPQCQSKGPIVSGPPSVAFRQLIEDTPVIEHEDVSFFLLCRPFNSTAMRWSNLPNKSPRACSRGVNRSNLVVNLALVAALAAAAEQAC